MLDCFGLDERLEKWARWCHQGQLIASGQSILGKLIDNQGVFGGGGCRPVLGCIEAEIEASVTRLAAEDLQAATILRREYGATGNPNDRTQFEKAHRLGISLPTYKRRLKKAREFVLCELNTYRQSHGNSAESK